MQENVADLRKEYTRSGLHEADMHADPIEQFAAWFRDAAEAGIYEPNLMTLSTATREGRPSVRTMLLKGFDAGGFVFYTNYDSRKGRELVENPFAAIVFWWDRLERQVVVEGPVRPTSGEEADAYFQVRPRGSQIGAWASQQSRVIASREILEERAAEIEARYADRDVPRPAYWGGFLIVPERIEFWQGRPSRLHDRIHYVRGADGSWTMERLNP
jgi:pyridoxamine 5'-phosphate oxidase